LAYVLLKFAVIQSTQLWEPLSQCGILLAFSWFLCVFGSKISVFALETFVTMRYIKLHLPYHTIPFRLATWPLSYFCHSYKSIVTKSNTSQIFWVWICVACYVTLWSWPLTLRPWTIIVYRLSRARILYQISAKSNDLRPSYSDLKIKSLGVSELGGLILPNFGTSQHRLALHVCFRYLMCWFVQNQCGSKAKFCFLDTLRPTPVEIGEGGRIFHVSI